MTHQCVSKANGEPFRNLITKPPVVTESSKCHRNIFQQIFYSVMITPWSIAKRLILRLYDKHKQCHTPNNEELHIYMDQWITSIDRQLCEFSDEVPTWFDPEKFARGRAFAMRHILGLVYSQELSVLLMLSLPMLRRPLIFSGNSDSAEKAFRRYLSTVERVMTWYAQDIWDKHSRAYHNLMIVRGMHNRVDYNMNSCTDAQRENKLQLLGTCTTPFLELLRADLEAAYGPNAQQRKWLDRLDSNSVPIINQAGMGLTQVGFVALLILRPGKFGAARASQSDLDDFVYVWYVLGHQLGIADRYNICAGGLQQTRRRCEFMMRHLVLPSLTLAERDWEHMSRCVVGGVQRILRQTSFEASIAYTLWALNVPTPHINTLITWAELPRLWLFKWVLCILLSVPGFSDFFGILLNYHLGRLRRRLDASDRKIS